MNSNLPTVAIHEFAQHPAVGDIVVATHGRSLWVLNVTALRQMSADTIREKAFLYKPNTVYQWRSLPSRGGTNRRFMGENPDADAAIFYSLGQAARRVSLKITDALGETIREFEGKTEPGPHCVKWDLRKSSPDGDGGRRRWRRAPRVEPGIYLVHLKVDNLTLTQPLRVERDPDYPKLKR